VASTRSAVQALSGVQIAVTPTGVELRATDMEIALRVPLTAEVVREGTVVLPARLLLDVARSLPRDAERVDLELRPEQQDVEIVAGHAKFHLRTLRAEDFPPLPGVGGSESSDTVVTLPAAAFVETIEKVAKSASRDETRPILTGILVSASGPELRMVATDSYRLSVKETTLESPLDGAVLSSRLIDGQFPNYRQLLPETYEHELRISGEELGDVVKRISLMAQKNAPLRLSFTEGELTVSAQTPDVGEASEPLPVPFAGEAFEIGFNPDFLRDGLDSVGSSDLVLKLISPLRPGLIEGADDSGFLYLIMPIRLNV
jgi:DNA polymerase-3 subunit beta